MQAQIQNFEGRIGRQVDFVHDYQGPGATLSPGDLWAIERPDTYLLMNWKPAEVWADAGGRNARVNAQIDAMADSIAAAAPGRLMLALFHEPADDVSPGGSPACAGTMALNGSAGTTADYRAMWANVRQRFASRGVTNVVWVLNYAGYPGADCMVKELWPGNDLVDWVTWNPYGHNTPTAWDDSVSRFYNVLIEQSDVSHDFLSKPWGLAEFGINKNVTAENSYRYYRQARSSVTSGMYPRLKMYMVFDALGSNDSRISYNDITGYDPQETAEFAAFATDPFFTDATYAGSGGS